MKLKHRILKAVDVSGFTFLDPIIRLICREEPDEQIRRIFKFIVVPIFAFVAFVLFWAFLAPRHTTKAGEVPTPAVVWDAAKGIWTFHQRENEKEAAYLATPENVEKYLAASYARMDTLESVLIPAAEQQVKDVANERFPIMLRSRHGVGKSTVVYDFAREVNLPVIERRASQMQEGDLVGLPEKGGEVTRFLPPEWLKRVCDEPFVLFIDEIDRGSKEVRQGFFELCDSRKVAGHYLHEDTLIFSAVNSGEYGSQYQVDDMG